MTGLFSDEIKRIDNSPDMEGAVDVVRHSNKYHLEVIEELLKDALGLSQDLKDGDVRVNGKVYLGPVLDDPMQDKDRIIYQLKEEFLNYLAVNGIIRNLQIIREKDESDNGYLYPWGIVVASFSYTPSKLEGELNVLKTKLLDGEHLEMFADKKVSTYIIRKNADYYYEGGFVEVSKLALYRTVFDCLFELRKDGGFVSYIELGNEIRKRVSEKKGLTTKEMAPFIRENLLDNNGFLHRARVGGKKIPNRITGGKKLISIVRTEGIEFNNNKDV